MKTMTWILTLMASAAMADTMVGGSNSPTNVDIITQKDSGETQQENLRHLKNRNRDRDRVDENRASDNSRVNRRDMSEKELTADQQKLNKTDTQITRDIRKGLIGDNSLSTYAKNVKVITSDGRVTLKGPVRSQSEEERILQSASSIVGPSQVTNEMTIVSK